MIDKKVVIYTTPVCPWCHRAKEYFSRKGIPYIEYDVAEGEDITMVMMRESGRDVAREMIRKGGQTAVPVITIDNEVIIGFDQARLDTLFS